MKHLNPIMLASSILLYVRAVHNDILILNIISCLLLGFFISRIKFKNK